MQQPFEVIILTIIWIKLYHTSNDWIPIQQKPKKSMYFRVYMLQRVKNKKKNKGVTWYCKSTQEFLTSSLQETCNRCLQSLLQRPLCSIESFYASQIFTSMMKPLLHVRQSKYAFSSFCYSSRNDKLLPVMTENCSIIYPHLKPVTSCILCIELKSCYLGRFLHFAPIRWGRGLSWPSSMFFSQS